MDLLRSLPLGLYLEQPQTWLHRLDPRVKLAWLMLFLITPVLSSEVWRLGLLGVLLAIALASGVPWRSLKAQAGWLAALALLVFGLTAILPDGPTIRSQPRSPGSELTAPAAAARPFPLSLLPGPPPARPAVTEDLPAASDYRFRLVEMGPLRINRQSLALAIRSSTLLFTVIFSTSLMLLTTAPEAITAGIEELLLPLRRFGLPVAELTLTLTLALRFIPLVLEEVQNLVRSIRTRAINWNQLGWQRSARIWFRVVERLLRNLLLRAEQMALGMQVRGFTEVDRQGSNWHLLHLEGRDWLALGLLLLGFGLRLSLGGATG